MLRHKSPCHRAKQVGSFEVYDKGFLAYWRHS
jgi:hypothetical protein